MYKGKVSARRARKSFRKHAGINSKLNPVNKLMRGGPRI